MMRKILFRGKCYDDGEWIFGSLLDDDIIVTKGAVEVDEEYINIVDEWSSVLPGTVGQYTGLKDKNGSRIFEGDIVCDMWGVNGSLEYCEKHGCWIVVPCATENRESYRKGEINDSDLCDFNMLIDESLIIGSIHDNPELLEVQG